MLEDDHELVTAVSGDGVLGASGGVESFGGADEHIVTGAVPERVVHRLEVVEIDEEHRHRAGVAAGSADGAGEAVGEQRSVGEPGERVVERAVAEVVLVLSAFRDVAGVDDQTLDLRVVATSS